MSHSLSHLRFSYTHASLDYNPHTCHSYFITLLISITLLFGKKPIEELYGIEIKEKNMFAMLCAPSRCFPLHNNIYFVELKLSMMENYASEGSVSPWMHIH